MRQLERGSLDSRGGAIPLFITVFGVVFVVEVNLVIAGSWFEVGVPCEPASGFSLHKLGAPLNDHAVTELFPLA